MLVTAFQIKNEKATEAPYKVSYHTALLGKVHTTTERLIQPCRFNVAECLLDEKSLKKITVPPPFNDLVTQSKDLAVHKKTALIFSLQS